MDVFQIRLLGELSVAHKGEQVQHGDGRSRRLWLLLSYLICHRQTPVAAEELIDLLWNGEDGSSNPGNALKTVFHRLRGLLDQLGNGVGHQFLLHYPGGYGVNSTLTLLLDTDQFERLLQEARVETEPQRSLALLQEALSLYGGDFLPKFSSESWVIPLSAYYHNLFIQSTYEALSMLADLNLHQEAILLCRHAVEIEPYDETLYAHLMRHLLALGEQQAAVSAYEILLQLLAAQFGVSPSEELRALHRTALRDTGERRVDLQGLTQNMLRKTDEHGALYCDFDFFEAIYSAESRMAGRSGLAIHVALLNVGAATGGALAKRSLDRCMENLRILMCALLRRGDIVSRCTASQYILLLPNTNYESACLVMDRILQKFRKKYPHSPALLRYSIQPLHPA